MFPSRTTPRLLLLLLLSLSTTPCFADLIEELVSDEPIVEGAQIECAVQIEETLGETTPIHSVSRTVRKGKLELGKLGTFSVTGTTIRQLRNEVLSRLPPPGELLYSVGVRVKPKTSPQSIEIRGAVNFDGPIPWEEEMTLAGALTKCGGLWASANLKNVVFIRDRKRAKLNLREPSTKNMKLNPGDIIVIQN